jgi:hypothetical protein
MTKKSDNPNATYLKPMPPKKGYRRGFEPRSGESESQRLERETAELLRRIENKKRYGLDYSNYGDKDIYAAGGAIDKPKPRIVPLPTSPRRVPPSLLPTKPPPKDRVIKKYAKGGTASKRGDGIARKGKTRGKVC